jgi:O-antigen/teichoic acid export membrane protein
MLAFNKKTAKRTSAAIIERALQGTVTFLVTIILGRWAGASELGLYSLVFTLVCVAIALQESLITAPYTVYALRHPSAKARRRYLGGVLAHSNILSALLAFIAGICAMAFLRLDEATYAYASMALMWAVPCVLLREFARRIVYAEMKPEDAVAISGMTGVMQLALMVALQATGRLNAITCIAALGVSSLLGGGVWLYRRRSAFQLRNVPIRETFEQNWTIGKWSFATQVGEIVRTQIFPWLLAVAADNITVGVFAACAAIAALPTPLHVAVSNLLIPQFVHAEKEGGVAAAHRLMWQATCWLTAVMLPFCLVVAVLGDRLILWVYGSTFLVVPGVGHALFVLALSQLLNGVSLPSARALFALRGADKVFASQMIGIVVNLALGLPMVEQWGIVGAAYAALIGSTLKAVLGAWWYVNGTRRAAAIEAKVEAASDRSVAAVERSVRARHRELVATAADAVEDLP